MGSMTRCRGLRAKLRRSGNYFLGGTVLSVDQIRERNRSDERILLGNIECNDFAYVVENCNSWKSVRPFETEDAIVDRESGEIVERGDTPGRVEYRRVKKEEHRKLLFGAAS